MGLVDPCKGVGVRPGVVVEIIIVLLFIVTMMVVGFYLAGHPH